jgi:L-alanine-DL-glutamate epimerase-like enolase superfamily enzyme
VRIRSVTPLPLLLSSDYSAMTFFVVRIETDDGLVGWGESCDCFGVSHPQVLQRIVETVWAPAVVGADLDAALVALEKAHWATRRTLGDQFAAGQSRSAVEIALQDLLGKRDGRSISARYGRQKDSLRIYGGNSHFLETREATAHAELLAPLLERGVGIFKLRIGLDWRKALRVLADLRALLPDSVELTTDASEFFTVAESIEIAKRLGDIGVGWLEEPVQSYRLGAIRQVVAASPVPIAYGEHFFGAEYALDAMELTGISVIQPDASILGGIDEARRTAIAAGSRGARVVMHLHGGPISISANAHVAASVGNVDVIEYPFHLSPVMKRVAPTGGFDIASIVDGRIAVPTGPGLGVVLDTDVIDAGHRAYLDS